MSRISHFFPFNGTKPLFCSFSSLFSANLKLFEPGCARLGCVGMGTSLENGAEGGILDGEGTVGSFGMRIGYFWDDLSSEFHKSCEQSLFLS